MPAFSSSSNGKRFVSPNGTVVMRALGTAQNLPYEGAGIGNELGAAKAGHPRHGIDETDEQQRIEYGAHAHGRKHWQCRAREPNRDGVGRPADPDTADDADRLMDPVETPFRDAGDDVGKHVGLHELKSDHLERETKGRQAQTRDYSVAGSEDEVRGRDADQHEYDADSDLQVDSRRGI